MEAAWSFAYRILGFGLGDEDLCLEDPLNPKPFLHPGLVRRPGKVAGSNRIGPSCSTTGYSS